MRLPLLPGGVALKISTAEGIVGGTVWPSAGVLCQHLLDRYYPRKEQTTGVEGATKYAPGVAGRATSAPSQFISNWNVLELGSGTGAVGLFAAGLGVFQSVHVTEHRPPLAAAIPSVAYTVDGNLDWDFYYRSEDDPSKKNEEMERSDRLLQLLQHNMDQNDKAVIRSLLDSQQQQQQQHSSSSSWPPTIHELDWTVAEHSQRILDATTSSNNHQHGFDLLLASDVTYVSELLPSLASTIARLLAKTHQNRPSSSTTQTTNDDTTMMMTSTTTPKCLVAHQQRVVNWKGADFQLEGLEEALEAAGLRITNIHKGPHRRSASPFHFLMMDEKEPEEQVDDSRVSILEIQHQEEDTESSGGNGDNGDELWIPSRSLKL